MGNKNFAVGLFVAIAVAAFTFTTIWLTGKRGTEPTVQYSMYFETDVSGLMIGGPVFLPGCRGRNSPGNDHYSRRPHAHPGGR